MNWIHIQDDMPALDQIVLTYSPALKFYSVCVMRPTNSGKNMFANVPVKFVDIHVKYWKPIYLPDECDSGIYIIPNKQKAHVITSFIDVYREYQRKESEISENYRLVG